VTDERAVLMPQDPHPLQLVEQIGDQVLMRSLAFYLALLAPLGLREWARLPTYRGTEEVIYLACGERDQYLGLRPADGGEHRYYLVGLEHLAFYVDTREEVDAAYQRCLDIGARVHFPPEEARDVEGYYEMFVFDPDGLRIEVACGPADLTG
jgi:catechol 2,3-dioxygenase-like lactoylglutathione lyase family enzyme